MPSPSPAPSTSDSTVRRRSPVYRARVTPGDLRIAVLARGGDDPELVARAYAAVLAPSFTDDELPPWEQFEAEVSGSAVLVATAGGEIVAAAVSDTGGGEPVGLLSHLAVRPDQRGTGTGSAVFDRLRSLWSAGDAAVVLGEVHDPRIWADAEDERPGARMRFYERHGARLLAVPWEQPELWPGGRRVPGMLLLVMGGRDQLDAVPSAWVATWMTEYYRSCEGIDASSGDPALDALLARVAAVDPIPVRAIVDLDDVEPLGGSTEARGALRNTTAATPAAASTSTPRTTK